MTVVYAPSPTNADWPSESWPDRPVTMCRPRIATANAIVLFNCPMRSTWSIEPGANPTSEANGTYTAAAATRTHGTVA
jgi:hypothetical protein